MNEYINNSLIELENYIRKKRYRGYDPYDGLNSKKLSNIHSKWMKILITQFFVYSPINLRRFFNIQEGINPKAIGLLLTGYCKLFKNGLIDEKIFNNIL